MWLKRLQIAIIEKDTDKLEKILQETPEFDSLKDMESALYLLKEAATLLYELKDETAQTMRKLKTNIDFLKSTESKKVNKLDIKL